VWAERYDRELDDPLTLQDELVARIVAELVPSLPRDPGPATEM
jgi:TolB-like protein